MKILILDSGIYKQHLAIKNEHIDGYGLLYDEESGNCNSTDDIDDYIGHGTAVYDLIHKNCPRATLKVIKIFSHSVEISEEALVSILEYVNEHENPSIINLSMGITVCSNLSALYAVCKKLYDRGVVLISAFDNSGAVSYPAAFDCVYGVVGIRDITNFKELMYVKNSCVNLCTKGTVSRLAWRQPDYIFMSGNSFSCAIASSIVANKLIDRELSLDEIPIENENIPESRKNQFTISKAALFPFNKEMHSLCRFSHLLPFQIAAIYEHKLTGRVGADAYKLIYHQGDYSDKIIIRDILSINWEEIDTLILGHMTELSTLIKDNHLRDRLVDEAKRHNVKIYSFDPCKNNEDVFCPKVTEEPLPSNRFGQLFKMDKPVVGVWGTSSRQGKYTLQLLLRENLTRRGYQVGQLGTEPSSLLFGMDEVFPYGYNSAISLNEREAFQYINRQMNFITRTNCEIILTGAQSAAISYDIDNITEIVPYQHTFLCATAPDAVVLVVSPHDPLEYITKIICYIQSSTDGEVVAIAFLPRYIEANDVGFFEKYITMTEDEIDKFKEQIERTLNLNTYNISDSKDIEYLTDKIIEYF